MIDDKTKQALAMLLDYVEEDEWEDYRDSDAERQANHIYRYVEIVRDWLGPVHCDQD